MATGKAITIAAVAMLLGLLAGPAAAQITVLDQAQDAAGSQSADAAAPGPCGTRAIAIAAMNWPSAEITAQIHAKILAQELGCQVQVIPGDLSATASSMGSSGEPAVAPEMWVTRVADIWNAGVEAQQVRPAAPSFVETQLEGWYMPDYVATAQPELKAASGLAAALPNFAGGAKVRFISCPADWACAVINRNLITAYGLGNLLDVVTPANRFEMDTLIAEAVSRKEPIVFYYWAPNAVLAQFSFAALDMGSFEADAAKCLAQQSCPDPKPSAFASETVVTAVSEWVFTGAPMVSAYFGRASMPLKEMDAMLAQLGETGATAQSVAERFVAERGDVWRPWLTGIVP